MDMASRRNIPSEPERDPAVTSWTCAQKQLGSGRLSWSRNQTRSVVRYSSVLMESILSVEGRIGYQPTASYPEFQPIDIVND